MFYLQLALGFWMAIHTSLISRYTNSHRIQDTFNWMCEEKTKWTGLQMYTFIYKLLPINRWHVCTIVVLINIFLSFGQMPNSAISISLIRLVLINVNVMSDFIFLLKGWAHEYFLHLKCLSWRHNMFILYKVALRAGCLFLLFYKKTRRWVW